MAIVTQDPAALINRLSQPESDILEFKAKPLHPMELAKLISSMANGKGGMIVIGAGNHGEVIGLDAESKEKLESAYQKAITLLRPHPQATIEFINSSEKQLAFISIEASSIPVRFNNKTYIRLGTSTRRANSLDTHKKRLAKELFFRKLITLAALFVVLLGAVVLGISTVSPERLFDYISTHKGMIIGAGLILLGYLMVLVQILIRQRMGQERKFIDVDIDSRETQRSRGQIALLERRVKQLTDAVVKVSGNQSAESNNNLAKSSITDCSQHPFSVYFHSITTTLSDKATNADQKASLLLDRGVLYARLGIGFYIVSIITWQLVTWIFGFKSQIIYGIASCSILFIFIEFISAWFLKQYRQFVDTSTYLIKVKSIFDKYMLMFLLANDSEIHKENSKSSISALTEVLKTEINWPETYLLKTSDTGFARETMSSMVELTKAIVDFRKSQANEDKPEK